LVAESGAPNHLRGRGQLPSARPKACGVLRFGRRNVRARRTPVGTGRFRGKSTGPSPVRLYFGTVCMPVLTAARNLHCSGDDNWTGKSVRHGDLAAELIATVVIGYSGRRGQKCVPHVVTAGGISARGGLMLGGGGSQEDCNACAPRHGTCGVPVLNA
jgi:hypothetical protein